MRSLKMIDSLLCRDRKKIESMWISNLHQRLARISDMPWPACALQMVSNLNLYSYCPLNQSPQCSVLQYGSS